MSLNVLLVTQSSSALHQQIPSHQLLQLPVQHLLENPPSPGKLPLPQLQSLLLDAVHTWWKIKDRKLVPSCQLAVVRRTCSRSCRNVLRPTTRLRVIDATGVENPPRENSSVCVAPRRILT